MSVTELEKAVTQLPEQELREFARWFAEFQQDLWDRQMEADSDNGRLDAMIAKAHLEFESGRCKAV